jgi:hypothetical protein
MRQVRAGVRTPGEVVFEVPDDVDVQVAAAGATRRRGSAEAGAPPAEDLLSTALVDAGMTIAADARLAPPPTRTRRAAAEPATVRVTVAPGEGAVLLVESDGLYSWVQSDAAPAGSRTVRGRQGDVLTFTLGAPAPGGRARRSLSGWLLDRLTKPIRTLVLKFVVRASLDALIKRIEGGNPAGLVRVTGGDPATWRPSPTAAELPPAPAGRPLRVLLLVHGTFSDTKGSFGHLATHAAGRGLVDAMLAGYDLVLGFDHKTLGESVERNAERMAEALDALPAGAQVDAVAYSRGGLVLRVLFDELLASRRPDIVLGRAIFVGCTNAGTHLASPANWEALADLYTNLIMAGARLVTALAGAPLDPFVRLGIKTLGEFVQLLAQVAVGERRVPGLASMEPDGDTVRRLADRVPGPIAVAYHAITSDFEPKFEPSKGLTRELAQALLDRVTDDLWQNEDNDLVVDTASMTAFGARDGWLTPAHTYAFGSGERVYHTVYFTAPETCAQVLEWLGLPQGRVRGASGLRGAGTPSKARRGRTRDGGAEVGTSERAGTGVRRSGAVGSSTRRRVSIGDALATPEQQLDVAAWDAAPAAAPAPPVVDEPPCHVVATMPEAPGLARPARLDVTLSREEIAIIAGRVRAEGVIPAAPDEPLEVAVSAKVNCEVVGDDWASSPAPKPGAPEALAFRVAGRAPGPAEVWVEVFQRKRRLVRLVLQPVFVSSGEIDATATASPQEVDRPIVDLRILEEFEGGRWRLRFLVSAPELDIEDEYETGWRTVDKTEYVQSLYRKLEDAWADSQGEFEPLMMLVRAEGTELFRGLFPEALQRLLWERREQIGSLQVFAQEPSIPWEVACVAEPGRPPGADSPFLAELGLTRWITNAGVAPARLRLRPGKALFCIPEYLDETLRLASLAEEAAMVGRVLGAERLEPHLRPVLSALGRADGQDFDLLHFACHGSADPREIWNSGLLLQGFERDGRIAPEALSLASVRTYARLAQEGNRPVVFLNACQTGVGGYGLTGAGGLAEAFVRGGAGLFVGTLWSVGDRTALAFSRTFYEQLSAGRSVTQAARSARERAKEDLESTWLAYSVYGHPYARVSAA